MIKAKGENPSPGEKPQGRMIFRKLLEVVIWSLALVNESSFRGTNRNKTKLPQNTHIELNK